MIIKSARVLFSALWKFAVEFIRGIRTLGQMDRALDRFNTKEAEAKRREVWLRQQEPFDPTSSQ